MLIQALRSVHNVSNLEELKRWCAVALEEIQTVVNGKLEFVVNVSSQQLTAEITTADTDLTVPHNLGKIPTGCILIRSSAAMSIYNGSTAWTADSICIRSAQVGTAQLLVF